MCDVFLLLGAFQLRPASSSLPPTFSTHKLVSDCPGKFLDEDEDDVSLINTRRPHLRDLAKHQSAVVGAEPPPLILHEGFN